MAYLHPHKPRKEDPVACRQMSLANADSLIMALPP
jgi:hypothetical protein